MGHKADPIDRAPLLSWFGFEHDMHDATVQSIELRPLDDTVVVRIAAFRMTAKADENGYFLQDRHAMVSFHMEGVKAVQTENLEFCTVLNSVDWEFSDGLHRLTLVSVMDGSETVLTAMRVAVSVEPVKAQQIESAR